jgi:hypothetical protein
MVRRAALVVAALLLGAANAAKMLAEFDLPWHLAFGRQIAATWAVPRVDDFAYTHSAIHYVGVVADLLLYWIIHLFGPLGLQVANGVVAIGIAATMLRNAWLRAKGPIALGIVAGAMVAMSPWTFVRPATFGFLLVGVQLLLIELHRRRGDKRALYAATVLPLIWCNMHGSVAVGVGVLGLYGLEHARRREFRPIGCAALAAVLACINPAGPGIFRGGAAVGSYDDILLEWHPTSWKFFTAQSPAAGVFLVAALLLIAAGKEVDGSRRPAPFDAALTVAAIALSTRTRFVPIAIVILAPIAAARAAGFVRDNGAMRAAFLLAACLAGPGVAVLDEGTFGVGFDPKSFPAPAVDYVVRSKPAGNMWNFWPYGGYLVWRLFPDQRVLIDGRIGFVHERDLVYDAIASEQNPATLAALDAKWHFDWAFCRADERGPWCLPFARSREWRMVFWDHMSAVYVRAAGPNATLADQGYHVLTHLIPPEQILALALREDGPATDLAHDAVLASTQDPTSPRSWFIEACAGLATYDRVRYGMAKARLAALAPDHPALGVLTEAASTRFAR